eukprot:1892697-Amphidinium_carterae.1
MATAQLVPRGQQSLQMYAVLARSYLLNTSFVWEFGTWNDSHQKVSRNGNINLIESCEVLG